MKYLTTLLVLFSLIGCDQDGPTLTYPWTTDDDPEKDYVVLTFYENDWKRYQSSDDNDESVVVNDLKIDLNKDGVVDLRFRRIYDDVISGELGGYTSGSLKVIKGEVLNTINGTSALDYVTIAKFSDAQVFDGSDLSLFIAPDETNLYYSSEERFYGYKRVTLNFPVGGLPICSFKTPCTNELGYMAFRIQNNTGQWQYGAIEFARMDHEDGFEILVSKIVYGKVSNQFLDLTSE